MKNRSLWRTMLSLMATVIVLFALGGITVLADGNPEIVASGYCGAEGNGENLSWQLDSAGVLTFSGTGAMQDFNKGVLSPWYDIKNDIKKVNIPNSVTNIGGSAFVGCKSLTSISIPNSVTSIGWGAFYNSSISSITIPNGVTSISDSTFKECHSLTSVSIPNSVTSIGNDAFWGCTALKSIDIPNSVTSIGENAFYACQSLTSITIPNGVTSISYSAFSGCCSLTAVNIPNSVTSIGNYAFYNCTYLTSINIPNSVTSIGDYAFSGCKSLDSISIPKNVTSIGQHTFEFCTSLTSVNIPDSVTSIGKCAFYYCLSITTINIPDSITSIGDYVFDGCESLTSIDIPNSVTSIGSEAFCNCTSLTSVTIPNSVTSIGLGAFGYCQSLTSIAIPNSVTSIGDYAFYGCESLTSIDIPNSVTSIGDCAFYCCESLTSIDIPNSVTSIGRNTFSYCTSLTSIDIPDSVVSIEEAAFENCESLTDVYFKGTRQQWEKITIYFGTIDKVSEKTIYDVFGDAKIWFDDISIIKIQPEDFYGSIGSTAVFSVESQGEGLKYQWQVFKSGAWKNTSLTGNKTSTLEVGILESRDGMKFRCVVSDALGNTVISDEAKLTVNSFAITMQPEDYAGPIGSNAEFTVAAEGENLTYQWQVYKSSAWKNTSLTGNKTSELEVRIVESRNGMKFRCVVTDGNGKSVASDEVVLTVTVPAVTITSEPEDYCGPIGDTAVFTVVAEGEELTYQWQVYKSGVWKNTSLTGNKTSTLEVGILESRDGMKFRCVVTDINGTSVASNEAIVTVGAKPVTITSEPEDYSGPVGDVATFEIEAEGENLTYQWQVYKSGAWKNTSLPGNTSSSLDVEITEARDGMTFRCVVKDGNGNKAISEEATLTVAASEVKIITEPENYTGSIGDKATFEVVAEGEDLTYQWQVYKSGAWKNTSLAGNKTDTLDVEVLASRDGMQFRCVVTDAYGNSETTETVTISVI